jgi:hypothetical protein
MDGRLRNGLWNVVDELLRRIETGMGAFIRLGSSRPSPGYQFLESIWVDFRGGARDMFEHVEPLSDFRLWFYDAAWNEVYDAIEFIASRVGSNQFAEECNRALERELAAYRVVGGKVVELTDEAQLKAIDKVVEATAGVPLVQKHLRTALARLADRPEPDYRNAGKEAICAVETLVGMISGNPDTTLDAGLKLIESRKLLPLHPSLVSSWRTLYGYAGDAGLRHGMKDGQAAVALDEAVYVIVTCSAIVGYLIAMADKAGLKLG